MADDITYTSTNPAGVPDATKQATDEHATRGHMPIVKVAYAADGDATLVPADANGLLVNLGANNDVTVTGSVTADLGVNNDVTVTSGNITADTELPAAAALADNTANPTVPGVGAFVMGWDGANWDRMPATAADGVLVNLGSNNDVSVTGTVTVDLGVNNDVTVTNATAANLNAEVQGDAAHDAAVSGNPVAVGFRANANEPSAVSTDNDAVWAWADLLGRQVVLTGHPSPEAPITINLTGDGQVIAAPGAGSLYICKGSVHNRGAANNTVALEDGSGGTERWKAELAAEGGGSVFDFGTRGWKLTATTALFADLGAAGDVDVNITEYYIAP